MKRKFIMFKDPRCGGHPIIWGSMETPGSARGTGRMGDMAKAFTVVTVGGTEAGVQMWLLLKRFMALGPEFASNLSVLSPASE